MTKWKRTFYVTKLDILDRIWGNSPAMGKKSLEGSGEDCFFDTVLFFVRIRTSSL